MAIAGNAAPFSLISLWVYAARNKPDGFLDNMDSFDIEIASNWTGQPNQLFDALVKCKFLTVADEGYYLHDWEIHQPYASGAEERSAKARFAILARHNRDLHTKLKEQGVNGLSVSDYKEYTKRIRPEYDSNTKTYKNLTPSPLPVPLPAPEPLPFPNTKSPADFEKSANENLPILEESEIEPSHVEELQPKQSKAEKSLKEKKPNAWGIWVDVNREFGRTDPFASGKDTRAAKSIMSQLKDPEKYADILRQFLSDDDKFLMQNGHSISFLSSKINKYLNKQYQAKAVDDTYYFSPEEEAEIWAMEDRIAKEEAEKAKQ